MNDHRMAPRTADEDRLLSGPIDANDLDRVRKAFFEQWYHLNRRTLVDVLLFGGFLVWAVADRISVKRRSVAEAHDAPAAPARPLNDAIALVGGLLTYAVVVLWAHRWLIGVSPLA